MAATIPSVLAALGVPAPPGCRFPDTPFVCPSSPPINEEDPMLGRKDYTPEELDAATTAVGDTLAAYRTLVDAVHRATGDPDVAAAFDAFEPLLFNELTLALDRRFVHRLRVVTGKDGNPLNELELMTESLMNNDGVLRGNNVIKLKPDETVLKVQPGERIAVSAAQFERLSNAVLAEIRAKFV
jgi:hypothetical protein